MLDKPDSDYKRTWDEVKRYLSMQVDYAKLTATEKLTVLLSAIAVIAVVLILGTGVLFYLSFAFVQMLAIWLGDALWAYLVMSGIFAVVLALVFIFRNKWIIDPVARFLSKLFLSPPDNN